MTINQNNLDHLRDMVQQGKMTADQANVEKVRMQRVLMVIETLPASVRKALNGAVKTGYLGHKKRDGIKPEVYYHPTFEYLANGERAEYVRSVAENLKKVCTP
jgi:hypothetical protein